MYPQVTEERDLRIRKADRGYHGNKWKREQRFQMWSAGHRKAWYIPAVRLTSDKFAEGNTVGHEAKRSLCFSLSLTSSLFNYTGVLANEPWQLKSCWRGLFKLLLTAQRCFPQRAWIASGYWGRTPKRWEKATSRDLRNQFSKVALKIKEESLIY